MIFSTSFPEILHSNQLTRCLVLVWVHCLDGLLPKQRRPDSVGNDWNSWLGKMPTKLKEIVANCYFYSGVVAASAFFIRRLWIFVLLLRGGGSSRIWVGFADWDATGFERSNLVRVCGIRVFHHHILGNGSDNTLLYIVLVKRYDSSGAFCQSPSNRWAHQRKCFNRSSTP